MDVERAVATLAGPLFYRGTISHQPIDDALIAQVQPAPRPEAEDR